MKHSPLVAGSAGDVVAMPEGRFTRSLDQISLGIDESGVTMDFQAMAATNDLQRRGA